MKWKDVGVTAGFILTISAPLLADTPSRPALAVRIYNSAGVSTEDLRVATVEAETILQAAGITVAWMDCWHRDRESPGAPEHCRQPLERNSLTIRLQDAAATTKRIVSMGYSLVNLPDRAPFLATVYPDLVASVARSASVDARPLLGRAIAHEIGHLLLNANGHGDAGLMREKWTRLELQKNKRSDWEFLHQETSIMLAAVATRVSEAAR